MDSPHQRLLPNLLLLLSARLLHQLRHGWRNQPRKSSGQPLFHPSLLTTLLECHNIPRSTAFDGPSCSLHASTGRALPSRSILIQLRVVLYRHI